jgi:hypothetical protein
VSAVGVDWALTTEPASAALIATAILEKFGNFIYFP